MTPRGGTRPSCDDGLFLRLLDDTLAADKGFHREVWRLDTSADDGRTAWAARRIGMNHTTILNFQTTSSGAVSRSPLRVDKMNQKGEEPLE